jgi:hypothetical protein
MSTKSSTKYSVLEVGAALFRLDVERSDLLSVMDVEAVAAAAAADEDDDVFADDSGTASARLDAGSGRIVRCTIVHGRISAVVAAAALLFEWTG